MKNPDKRSVQVAVAVPSNGVWMARTGAAISTLITQSAAWGIGICIISEENSIIEQGRNNIVRAAIKLGADYILWIDSDMLFPPNALARLLGQQKDMICAFYNQRMPPYRTIGKLIGSSFDVRKGGVHEADRAGFGFMLTNMKVFKTLTPPWFNNDYRDEFKRDDNPDGLIGEDLHFIEKARKAGFKLYCDLDLTFEMGHIGLNVIPCMRPPPDKTGDTNGATARDGPSSQDALSKMPAV